MGDMGAMMGHGMMPWFMAVASLAVLGVLVLVIVGLIAGLRWLTKGVSPSAGEARSDSALTLLRERYARGEISREEFERIRQDLT